MESRLIAELQRKVAQKTAAAKPLGADQVKRMTQLRDPIDNLTDAVASGALKASPALAGRLAAAEAELAQLAAQAAKPTAKVIDFPACLAQRCKKLVEGLEQNIGRELRRARAAPREICGEIKVIPQQTGGIWWRSYASGSSF